MDFIDKCLLILILIKHTTVRIIKYIETYSHTK